MSRLRTGIRFDERGRPAGATWIDEPPGRALATATGNVGGQIAVGVSEREAARRAMRTWKERRREAAPAT